MKGHKPLVSVIITNYNYANYVGEAIQSTLDQTHEKLEIIIIDDGSTDDSHKVIKKYTDKDDRIVYIQQKNKGVVAARNVGLDTYTGEFVLFLDGDDKIPANYVQVLVDWMNEEGVDVAYTDYERFGEEEDVSAFPEYDFEKLKQHNFIHVSAMIRRSAVGKNRFDDTLQAMSHEDWDFFLGIAYKKVAIKKNHEVRLQYRSHNSSRSLQLTEGVSAEYAKQALKTVKSFLYIVEKYQKMYPGTIDIVEGSEIVEWGKLSMERMQFIQNLRCDIESKERAIEQKDKCIEEQNVRYESLINSKKYKLATYISSPIATLKSKFSQEKKS